MPSPRVRVLAADNYAWNDNCGQPPTQDVANVPCDPGFVVAGIGRFSAADINFAARAIFAESSGNTQEDAAIADVIYNRLDNPLFSGGRLHTLSAVVSARAPSQFNAVTPPGPNGQFIKSANPGRFWQQGSPDCTNLTKAIAAIVDVIVSGPSASYNMFAAAGTASGKVIGGSVFWFSQGPGSPVRKRPLL